MRRDPIKKLEFISTRQVAARIRAGRLPLSSKGGEVRCACHPSIPGRGATEALRFWSKGDRIACPIALKSRPALAVHRTLGVVIDTRL